MPFRLPIFPLSVVLFPGTPLPLHIFEPRYKQMLADCLAADRRFVLSRLLDESLPYLTAMVEAFEDDFAALRELNDTMPEDLTLPDDPVSLSFQVASGKGGAIPDILAAP